MPHTFCILSLLFSLIKGGHNADELGSYGPNCVSFDPVSVPVSSTLLPQVVMALRSFSDII